MTESRVEDKKSLADTLIEYFFAFKRTKWGWEYDAQRLERYAKKYLWRTLGAVMVECAFMVALAGYLGIEYGTNAFSAMVTANSMLVIPLTTQFAAATWTLVTREAP